MLVNLSLFPYVFMKTPLHAQSEFLAGKQPRHSIQTNAVLLDADWVDLFKLNNVCVGVSIDGPPEIHDTRRRTRRGGGTFHKAMQGIKFLQACGLNFDVIAVITPETLRRASAFMDFFENLEGMRQLGLNIEETEGTHISEAFAEDNFENKFRTFLGNLMTWAGKTGIVVREFQSMRSLIFAGAGSSMRNTQNEPFTILSIASNGDMATFSPELQGMVHPIFGNFSIGNVLLNTPDNIPPRQAGFGWRQIFLTVRRCAGLIALISRFVVVELQSTSFMKITLLLPCKRIIVC